MNKIHVFLISILCLGIFATLGAESLSTEQIRGLLREAELKLNSAPGESFRLAEQALVHSRRTAKDSLAAKALLLQARSQHQSGIYDQALEYGQDALRIAENIRNHRLQAEIYEQMGSTYWRLKNPAKVQEYYGKSLSLRRRFGSPAELADALNSSGIVQLHYLNNPERALSSYREALELSQSAEHKLGIAHSLNNLGNYYLIQGDLQQALSYNLRSRAIYSELGDRNRATINLLIIGYINQLLGNESLAEQQYFEVIKAATEINSLSLKRDALLNLSSLYEIQGKELQHLRYYKEYASLSDSLNSSEVNSNIANLQTQFEVEKEQLQNAILDLKIRQHRIILAALSVLLIVLLGTGYLILREKKKSEKLLLNILPRKVADELRRDGTSPAQTFPEVSVLFSDIVNFTALSSQIDPQVLIAELSDLFTLFDQIAEDKGCERIKTIGDAYLAVCGLPEAREDHAIRILELAQGMLRALAQRNLRSEHKWEIRIGLHTGELVGGIVGIKKYIYDVFGDTVNTASRMEANSESMRINVSEEFYLLTRDRVDYESRPISLVKGKGDYAMYFVP